MSDPAIAAARVAAAGWFDHAYPEFSQTDLITAAREALAPIRELHHRRRKMHVAICDECRCTWPCATARLVYTTEELETRDE